MSKRSEGRFLYSTASFISSTIASTLSYSRRELSSREHADLLIDELSRDFTVDFLRDGRKSEEIRSETKRVMIDEPSHGQASSGTRAVRSDTREKKRIPTLNGPLNL